MSCLEGLILGISNGPTCLTVCLPAIVPFLLAEGKNISSSTFFLIKFMIGRLIGYLIFAVLAWVASSLILTANSVYRELIFGIAYLLSAILMLTHSLYTPKKKSCSLNVTKGFVTKHLKNFPSILIVSYGLLTGISLCPPFLAVFTEAVNSGALLGSIKFFILFFIGTSIFFIPIPFIGALQKFKSIKHIGKGAAFIMSLYYFYIAIDILDRSIRNL